MAEKEIIECEDLAKLVNEVITENKMDYLAGVDIKSVLVYPNISKTCAGKCSKNNYKLSHFIGCEYLLEFSGDIWDVLKEDIKKILILHELKHILVVTKDGNVKYKIQKHNVEDFYEIIDKFGINWLGDLRTLASSVYNFENGEQDNIKI